MSEVVIIGGGISGLAAAYELERRRIAYTLIEVKKRLGGSIVSERRAGFVVDGGTLAVGDDEIFPAELDLEGELFALNSGGRAFRYGTQTLVEALAKPLTGAIMRRMAVSSVGAMGKRLGVCLENGLLLDTRAVMVAAPARYAAHMLHSLEPELGEGLAGYHYDTIQRVSLGYPCDVLPLPIMLPPDMAFAFWHWTDSPHRVPSGQILVQMGVRLDPRRTTPGELVEKLVAELGWARPTMSAVHYWAEADPLSCYDNDQAERMAALKRRLPPGVALIGSDYARHGVPSLSERVQQGQSAAREVAEWLGLG